jgi:sterol desaturase/sphingolipid hydroxylase (fatty acid hydroxylase superfamily)
MAQKFLYYISLDQTHLLLSLCLILFYAPLERKFPRVNSQSARPGITSVIIIGFFSYGAAWLFKETIYLDTISVFLNLQFFSLSKSDLPISLIYFISFLFIDFIMYLFHFLSHKVNFLWKLHSVHHTDEHVSAKTGVLHHPFETLASLLFALFFSVILGIPILVLILFAACATIHNLFAHANIALPTSLDRTLRKLIVTPDVHRTHHSIEIHEGNSNFGEIFTIWDRLFGTYTDHPASGEEKLVMGLPASEQPKSFSAINLLLHPFAKVFSRASRSKGRQ